jgi:hypothetical protein
MIHKVLTDATEYTIRSKLQWNRDGADWILFYNKRRMGRVIPDGQWPNMCRSTNSGGRLSDMANLTWSKGAVFEEVMRGLAWDTAHTPAKCPVNEAVNQTESPLIDLSWHPAPPLAVTLQSTL